MYFPPIYFCIFENIFIKIYSLKAFSMYFALNIFPIKEIYFTFEEFYLKKLLTVMNH